jgi:nicotinate-nucleotide pyrophosphorylase (carboxylating)
VRQARLVEGRAIVVQLRGEGGSIADEAEAASSEGAEMLMVDTGRVADLLAVAERVRSRVERHEVQLSFGGGVRAANLESVIDAGAHVIDVGRAILDAPMVDFRLDVG